MYVPRRRTRCALAGAIALTALLPDREARAQVVFDEVPGAFTPGSECVAENGFVGCDTWYVRAVDIDGDADLDVLFPTRSGQLLVYANDGDGNFTDNTAAAVGPVNSSV